MKKLLCLLLAVTLMMGVFPALADLSLMDEFCARVEQEGAAGMWVEWPLEDIRRYQDVIVLEGELLDAAPEGWLTLDQARDIAVAQILATNETVYPQAWYDSREPLPLTGEYLLSLKISAIPAKGTEEGHDVWYIWIYDPEWMVPALDCFAFRVDAHSGEILYSAEPGGWG